MLLYIIIILYLTSYIYIHAVERHYYRPDSIQGENSLLQLYVDKAMPYLTISDESRLKLKNRELEVRLKEESSRFDHLQEQINQILAANKKYGL
jgi:hypothetical protein